MYQGPEQFLNSDASTARLMAHARLLLKLSRRFETLAPPGLRHAAHVANYKSGTIVIHTENGAVAAKLRQLSQRLCDELSKGGPECNGMLVKVQPRQLSLRSSSSTQKPLSAAACESLQATAETLPDGPLKGALATLLARVARRE
ncbi:MAG TPA: DciA family protein [Azonexus sp.]